MEERAAKNLIKNTVCFPFEEDKYKLLISELFKKFNFNNLNNWIINNSEILNTINNINEIYIYKFIPNIQIEDL